jgi:hypothetical protein
MMTPKPDRILWCYGEYQTLYGTVEGREFQQDLPDLDNLENPKQKRIIGFQNIIGFFFITL